jgi:hypothetical protein
MKAVLFIAVSLLSLFFCPVRSQRVVDVNKEDVSPLSGLFLVLGGEPISLARYVKVVEGSPFFSEQWMMGTLILPGGTKYDSVRIRLDLMADEVHYQDKSGNQLIANNRIREIWLTDSVTQKRYHFIHSSFIGSGTAATAGWHLMLAEGAAILFKKPHKEILETKPYGSATFEQHITTAGRYLILSDKIFTPVKSLSAIADLLSNMKAELGQYISSNKLKGKSDGDYISLVSYYNSLLPK